MRMLFVDLEREWRGGQSQALLTLTGLREQGLDVQLLAAKASPLAERARKAGIETQEVARLGLRGWAALALTRLLSRTSCDLVHLNEPHALTAAWLAGAHRKLPLLLSRRIGFPLRKGWASRARYAAVARFIPNSKDVAQSLIDSGVAGERISIVNEGVEIPEPYTEERKRQARSHWGVSGSEFLVGCVSVFVPEKGQRHLIEALADVRKEYPNVKLLLAGDGRCRKQLEMLAGRLGLGGAVLFPGFVTNVDQVYAALDAFAFPSEFEGLGTALQAAMAAGLPCISTTRGALGEVVEGERTALVAEPTGPAFAGGISRLVADKGLCRRLGTAGRSEIQQRFSVKRMVENTIHVYEEVSGERKQK